MISFFICISILFRVFYVFFKKYKTALLYPEYFILLPPVFIFIIPYFLNGCEELSVISNFGLIIIFIISFISSRRIFLKSRIHLVRLENWRSFYLKLVSIFAYILLLVQLYSVFELLKTTSLIQIYLSNRLESYFDESIDKGSVLGAFTVILSFFYYIKISILFTEKKYKLAFFFVFAEIFYLTIFAVTRLSVVFPIISVVLFFLFKANVSMKKLMYSFVFFMTLLVFYMSFSNKLRTGQDSEVVSLKESLKDVSQEINYDQYHIMAEKWVDLRGVEFGYGWYLGSIMNFIPRFVYPNKPVTSSANRYTEKVTGMPPSMNNPVITFTLIGDGYFQLSYLGIILNLIFFYVVASLIFWNLYYFPDNMGIYPAIRFSFFAFIYFRAEIPFVQFFIYLILIIFTNIFVYNNNREIPNTYDYIN
jgi:hypothetical protein